MEDKRVKHTKIRIQDAMLTCLQDTSLDHVTVKKICEVADINRSTFYVYYPDPFALYEVMEKEAIEGFRSTTNLLKAKKLTYKEFLQKIVEYIGENSRTFIALIRTNRDSVKQMNISFLETENLQHLSGGKTVNPYVLEFYIGGMLELITKWIENGQRETPAEIAEIIHGLNI